jgi:4-hydroxythreonine-4-phosphate dehydrogenase
MARIGIALGDVTGIGPEVTLKALAVERNKSAEVQYTIIGDLGLLQALNKRLALDLPLQDAKTSLERQKISVLNPLSQPLPQTLHPGAPEAARAAVAWVKEGAQLCLRGHFEAIVTAPVNKEAIVRAGIPFVGQTELLSQIAGTDRTAMMLLGQDDRGHWLRVALVTTHLPLKSVAAALTREKIEIIIELTALACRDLGLPMARIGVCGLNPHAGEGGAMGDEEIVTIAPAVAAVRQRHIEAIGPLSADALFYYAYRGDYDAVVAMYHDQGLAPLKTVAFEQGVNWTLGLPFIRTSPDHGTAYDIAGTGKANPSSMVAAMRLATELVSRKRSVAQ